LLIRWSAQSNVALFSQKEEREEKEKEKEGNIVIQIKLVIHRHARPRCRPCALFRPNEELVMVSQAPATTNDARDVSRGGVWIEGLEFLLDDRVWRLH
jgi:hypothetical protein